MYNNMRLSGLASGIDTDEMVQNLMRAERIKVDRVEQDKQIAIWRQEAYNSINKDFVNFILNSRKKFGLTSITPRGTFRPNSYQNLNWVKKARSSNESIATVSTTGQAMDGNYRVEVKQLADGVSMASGSEVSVINNEGKIIDKNDNIVKNIEFTISDGNKEFHIKVNNENGITMNDVVRAINTAKVQEGEEEISIGVRASYDAGIGRFFLQTTNTGENAKIQINSATSEGQDFIEDLNLFTGEVIEGENQKYELGDIIQGKNAIINFNGANNISSHSNRITINGITMDIVDTGDFTINIGTDVDAVYEKIEEFINDYNELVEKTNRLLGEKQYRSYRPLTADERKAMDKEDIELWEEKAKSGLLRNDDIIQRTMLGIRRAIYEKSDEFNGPFKLITEIGISTEEYSRGSAGGKLVIDEEKLKKAIADNPEGVMEFLFKESVPETKDEEGNIIIPGELGGIVSRIHDNLMNGMEDIIKKSGIGDNEADLYRNVKFNILLEFVTEQGSISLLDKDVLQFNRRIDDLNAMLFRKENSYYAKFTAMEKAISRMNQQSMWLMQQTMG